VSADALRDVEARRTATMDAWQASSQEVATAGERGGPASEGDRGSAALTAERDAVQVELGVTAEMAADLKGDRFQNYLLEEAFRALVTGASVACATSRTDIRSNGRQRVLRRRSRQRRGAPRADTLSGGETFMAALCLALQLSDEVLRTSGALQMDSLFIDEVLVRSTPNRCPRSPTPSRRSARMAIA